MKTSKCQSIYRNVSKTSDRDNEKTLKVDKIEFFGNFPRNVFCAFAVTLLARPKKLDVDDHSCFASPSCDDQSFAGRNLVFRRILWQSSSPISHQVTCAPPPTLTPKKCTCTCAGCTHQQDIKRGRDCYTPGFLPDWLDHHRFPTRAQKGQIPPHRYPPAAHLLPDPPS